MATRSSQRSPSPSRPRSQQEPGDSRPIELPQFERATRRAFLRQGLAATGAIAAGVLLAACSKSDADTFSATTIDDTTDPATAAPSTTPTTRPTTAPTTTATTTPTTEPGTASASNAGSDPAFEISFSSTASDSSGRVRPYIAVWVEDVDGALAALVGVWYSTREAKYLRELTDFTAAATSVSGDQLDAVSGASRSAGRYQLHWDGRGLDGPPLTGTPTLWVEASREHGPHSVTSGPLPLDPATSTTIAGDGELSDIVVSVA